MIRFLFFVVALLTVSFPAAFAVEGHLVVGGGEEDTSLEEVDSILARQPADAGALFQRALILSRMGRTNDAIRSYIELIKAHPNYPEPYNNLAILYASSGREREAARVLEAAVRVNPDYAVAWKNLGNLYLKQASDAFSQYRRLDNGRPASVLISPTPQPERTPVARAMRASAEPPAVPAPSPVPQGLQGPADAVRAWAAAWSAKDVDAYLAAYAPEFHVPGGLSRNAWEMQRRERIAIPGALKVSVGDFDVREEGAGEARVSFTQSYRSRSFDSVVRKTLAMRRLEGRWRIVAEEVGDGR